MKTRTLSLLFPILLTAAPAFGERFDIVSGGEGSSVEFLSKAPLESFTGKTDRVSGRIEVDLSNLNGPAEILVEVDLASLDTGISLRNKHMRENHLHTDEHPKAVFRGVRVSGASGGGLAPGGSAEFVVEGDFSLHGTTLPLEAKVAASLDENGALSAECRFDIDLSDYGIPRPEFLFLRLDEVQRVTVKIAAGPSASPERMKQ